mgnify:CR=1 FL=1
MRSEENMIVSLTDGIIDIAMRPTNMKFYDVGKAQKYWVIIALFIIPLAYKSPLDLSYGPPFLLE